MRIIALGISGALSFGFPLMLPNLAMAQNLSDSGQKDFAESRGDQFSLPSVSLSERYILGAGDQIRLDIFDIPEVQDIQQTILIDGTITLPWIGKVSIVGLTSQAAAENIAQSYETYLHNPLVTIEVLQPRPLQVGIVGEVKRPGGYTLRIGTEAGESNSSQQRVRFWPTLTQAIEAAGGITHNANVRSIQVQRPFEETILVDLWQLIETGDTESNIFLRDGDQILVPTAPEMTIEESTQLASSSFAPNITVNVVGQVASPGTLQVPLNTSLNQAILAAGGFNEQANKQTVELVRLNPNGSVTQQEIVVDLTQGVDTESNPVLQEGDAVVVDLSAIAATSDKVNRVSSPLFSLLGLLNFLF